MERLVVICDDLDTPVGAVRLRAKGGTGGHNGMRSIHQRLGGSSDFPRLRIGIGRPTTSIPIASYVTQVGTLAHVGTPRCMKPCERCPICRDFAVAVRCALAPESIYCWVCNSFVSARSHSPAANNRK